MKQESKLRILLRGLIQENPVLVLVLGTCPTLATSTSVVSAVGMGLSAMVVLVLSNMAISALYRHYCGLRDGGADASAGVFAAAV